MGFFDTLKGLIDRTGEDDPEDREEHDLLFEIKGRSRKRSRVAVYTDRIEITFNGEDDVYTRDNVFDIYVKEPIIDNIDSRTTVIDFYEEGEQNYYELEDSVFPGLAENMERILKNEWSYILKKHNYPQTIQWFIACCAIVEIVSEQNPYIFGGAYKEPENIAAQRKVLYESWNFNNKQEFLNMLPKLLDGRVVREYASRVEVMDDDSLDDDERILFEKIAEAGGERCMWAWDLQRLIFLSARGYVCDYISWDDALEWCLKAGQKLQSLYKNWDDFMHCYLLGYCYFSGESLEDEGSDASERQQVYAHYKTLPGSPWRVAWDYPLTRQW
jgi:hypothetical protein